jgi:hypothetical protein
MIRLYFILISATVLSSCAVNNRMSKEYSKYKTMYKNYILGHCISEFNNLKPKTKEYVPPDKIPIYNMQCSEELFVDGATVDTMFSFIEKIRPILERRVSIATETMGTLNAIFPETDCITNECLKMYYSKELDKAASEYAKRRIKNESNKKVKR